MFNEALVFFGNLYTGNYLSLWIYQIKQIQSYTQVNLNEGGILL